MNVKDLASGVKRLHNDDVFCYIIESIKKDQANIFLNPHSSKEDREIAHEIIRGLSKIEDQLAVIIQDERIFDKKFD
jgi:hypothetical protein